MCFSVFFGFTYILPYSVYYAVVLQHNQSSNETLVVNLIEMEATFGGLLLGQTSRFILNYLGGIAVFAVIALLWLLLIVLSLFVRPKKTKVYRWSQTEFTFVIIFK